jgi:hypothetical protein
MQIATRKVFFIITNIFLFALMFQIFRQQELKLNPLPETISIYFDKKEPELPFIEYKKLRNVGQGVLGDIISHSLVNYTKSDDVLTIAHELIHFINSDIYLQTGKIGFYCLNDRAITIENPILRINQVSNLVPYSLRGNSYNLYMIEQVRYWDKIPTYILDEWIAYTNASICASELKAKGYYSELLQAHNFNVYSICLAMSIKKNCPTYDDKLFRSFLMWNIERTFDLLAPSIGKEDEILKPYRDEIKERKTYDEYYMNWGDDKNPLANSLDYVEKLRSNSDAHELREFCRDYFGENWCKTVMGF